MKKYHGVDLHRNSFLNCTLDARGKEELKTWSINKLKNFAEQLGSEDEVAVEATSNTHLFCQALKGSGCRVVIVNPHQFKVISRSVNKTDENDAKVLARFLSKDMLPEIRMKNTANKEISSLVQTRDKLVKLRTALKNKVNNLLASYAILIKRESLSSEKGLRNVLAMSLPRLPRIEVSVLVDQIRSEEHTSELQSH